MTKITVAGLPLPFDDPWLLGVLALHVVAALTAVTSGITAMVSPKRIGVHPRAGRVYFFAYAAVFVSAVVLSTARWAEDWYLFLLALPGFGAAFWARRLARHRGPGWIRLHILGMGSSYIILMIAFYVDNGKIIPIWRDLPPMLYWALPLAVGIPLTLYAWARYSGKRRP